MLALAVQAGLPVISVTTEDTINATAIIERVTGNKPVAWSKPMGKVIVHEATLYYVLCGGKPYDVTEDEFVRLRDASSALILVNPEQPPMLAFNAGRLETPKEMMVEVIEAVLDAKHVPVVLPALAGLTLHQAYEVMMVTAARDSSITRQGIAETRRGVFALQRGLVQVDTKQDFYEPSDELADLVAREKPFFLNGNDLRLVPRGIACDGAPGTGKTSAAKFIAGAWGVPLFRVDMGLIKGRWVGESEDRLASVLSQAEQEAPCVLVLDEVEKLFHITDQSHDTSASMLAQLLWWLAEHRARVFTVMTTNRLDSIPPELVRPGRIDRVLCFEPLPLAEAKTFLMRKVESLGGIEGFTEKNAAKALQGYKTKTHAHAMLAQLAVDLVKASKSKAHGGAK